MSLLFSSTPLRSAAAVYVLAAGALVAYNIRWNYISTLFKKNKPKRLPVTKVEGNRHNVSKKRRPTVIMLHGMWHDATYFQDLQLYLQQHGYTSYAIDLLPGERLLPGFTQREIVRDLEETLSHYGNDDMILLGHSQGGLVAQSCMLNSVVIRKRCKAIVLMGTYPLGLSKIPIRKLLNEPRNMYNHIGYAWICLFGKLMNIDYLKHIFLLPTTDETLLEQYTSKILKAPSDGFITMSHFFETVGIVSTKPTLILGAKDDVIYPPHLLTHDFDARFTDATHVVIPNQAHCFMDPDDDKTKEKVLVEWLEALP